MPNTETKQKLSIKLQAILDSLNNLQKQIQNVTGTLYVKTNGEYKNGDSKSKSKDAVKAWQRSTIRDKIARLYKNLKVIQSNIQNIHTVTEINTVLKEMKELGIIGVQIKIQAGGKSKNVKIKINAKIVTVLRAMSFTSIDITKQQNGRSDLEIQWKIDNISQLSARLKSPSGKSNQRMKNEQNTRPTLTKKKKTYKKRKQPRSPGIRRLMEGMMEDLVERIVLRF